jgi:hypothetical protein
VTNPTEMGSEDVNPASDSRRQRPSSCAAAVVTRVSTELSQSAAGGVRPVHWPAGTPSCAIMPATSM